MSDASSRVVGLRDLNRRTSDVIRAVEAGEPVLITRQGQPVAAIVPVDREGATDLMVGFSSERAQATRAADEQAKRGETHSASDVLARLQKEAEPEGRRAATAARLTGAVAAALAADLIRELRGTKAFRDLVASVRAEDDEESVRAVEAALLETIDLPEAEVKEARAEASEA